MKSLPTIQGLIIIVILFMSGCAAPATHPVAIQPSPTQAPATQVPTKPVTPPVSPKKSSAEAAASQESSNREIVLEMVSRLNAGDVEGSLAFFAEDAVAYIIGFPPTGIEIYKGNDQIRALWEDSAANHFEWETEISSENAEIVNTKSQTWHDFTRQIGVAPLDYRDVFEVVDGKIVTYGSWLTEESLARFRPAFAAAAPPESTAVPVTDQGVSELVVTIEDNSCTTSSPIALKAGTLKVTMDVKDQNNSKYALTLFTLDPDKDYLDLMAATVGLPPSWADIMIHKVLSPGMSENYTFTLEKGPVYLICWSSPPDLPIGNAGPFPVIP